MTRFLATLFSERWRPYYFLGLVLALDLCVHGVIQARLSGFFVGWAMGFFGSRSWSRRQNSALARRILFAGAAGYVTYALLVFFAAPFISSLFLGALGGWSVGMISSRDTHAAKDEAPH